MQVANPNLDDDEDMLDTAFTPWPNFSMEEADAIRQTLLSNRVNYWTGQECRKFEEEFATWSGTAHAISLANGTLALELALRGLGIGPGDEVVVTPRTFIASVSCVINVGAIPVFADVDPDSGNMTAQTISKVLSPKTRAVICVHLAGWPCDMDPIMALAAEHDLKVIEDCAQAHGARYKGRSVGGIGHIGAWSFCQDKIMTTGGEGGMITTNEQSLWQRMWSYKDHGKDHKAVHEQLSAPGFRWLHENFGSNFRMTEIQAVIGRIQLKRMADWSARRSENATRIHSALQPFAGEHGVIRSPIPMKPDHVHAYYKLYAYIRPENLAEGWTRDRIIASINAQGVPCYYGICPEVYRETAFDRTPFRPAQRLPVAKVLGETSIMFLVHPTLKRQEIEKTAEVIGTVLTAASLQDA